MKFQRLSTFALAAVLSCATLAAYAKPVQLTDVNGRKVTVDLPAKRVVWAFIIKTTWPSAVKTR